MCTLFIGKKVHSKYKLIFMGNRDEFYKRPTLASHYWSECKDIYGGRDLLSCGSWTAINKNGRIAFLTNYRDFSLHKEQAISRGKLVYDFLRKDMTSIQYLDELKSKSENYDPYNIIFGDIHDLYYFNNVDNSCQRLEDGIYGLSNSFLNTPWKKVQFGMEMMQNIVSRDFQISELLDIMENDLPAEDSELPETGLPYDKEKLLSRLFIKSESYGTRVTTIILVDNNDKVEYVEKDHIRGMISYRTIELDV